MWQLIKYPFYFSIYPKTLIWTKDDYIVDLSYFPYIKGFKYSLNIHKNNVNIFHKNYRSRSSALKAVIKFKKGIT
jgi:hypothetical protein